MYLGEASGFKLGKATRDAFGVALKELGATHKDLCVVDADVGNSTRTEPFGKAYPDRTFNVGIAESGSATADISVARQFLRNRNTTITASSAPSINVSIADS